MSGSMVNSRFPTGDESAGTQWFSQPLDQLESPSKQAGNTGTTALHESIAGWCMDSNGKQWLDMGR